MKSYELYVQGLYTAILSQVAEEYPSDRKECERDLSRVLSAFNERGFGFVAVDLAKMGKHFDLCLSTERLILSQLPHQAAYKKGTPIPRLFKGLMLRVFERNGYLRADPDVRAISFLRQLYQAAKKIEVSCTNERTWKTVHEFFEIESEVRPASLDWDADELCLSLADRLCLGDLLRTWHDPLFPIGVAADGSRDSVVTDPDGVLDTTQQVADRIATGLGWFDPAEWRAKHGPGAVADLGAYDNKYEFPSWPAKLDVVFPQETFAFYSEDHLRDNCANAHWRVQPDKELLNYESPSRLIAVPKTYDSPRLIASEPVSHQFCQQITLDFLRHGIEHGPLGIAIHLNDQTENQKLCTQASLTGSHATIDLSSASDRVSCWLVERMFRRNITLLAAFHACRTRWVVNNLDKKNPRFLRLRKFSCMGSALTFPVQSIVFSIIAAGVLLTKRDLRVTSSTIRWALSQVRIFGDDMIVPTDCWELLTETLEHLGLKVNRAKTFGVGRFRESCGMDSFRGHDVTSVKPKSFPSVSRPESVIGSVQTANNFEMKGFTSVSEFIRTTVTSLGRFIFPEVSAGSGALGWTVLYPDNTNLRTRYNVDLQRREYRVTSLRTKQKLCHPSSYSSLFQFFTEARRAGPEREPITLGVKMRPRNSLVTRWVPLP